MLRPWVSWANRQKDMLEQTESRVMHTSSDRRNVPDENETDSRRDP